MDLCVAPAPTCQALGHTCTRTHGYTRSHTGCIQMHTQSKYSLRQAELLILLLFPLQHFHSPQFPLFSLSLSACLSRLFSPILQQQKRTAPPLIAFTPASSSLLFLTLPPSLPVTIHLSPGAVSGWLCICSFNLSHLLPCLPSITHPFLAHTFTQLLTRTNTHIYTQALIPGLSGPFNFYCLVELTSPPFQPLTTSLSFLFHTVPLFSLVCCLPPISLVMFLLVFLFCP